MIVKESGEITQFEWTFKGYKYRVISTKAESRSNIWETMDTVKREDGMTKTFSRIQLKNYFNTK